jgi:hypothetical protein
MMLASICGQNKKRSLRSNEGFPCEATPIQVQRLNRVKELILPWYLASICGQNKKRSLRSNEGFPCEATPIQVQRLNRVRELILPLLKTKLISRKIFFVKYS